MLANILNQLIIAQPFTTPLGNVICSLSSTAYEANIISQNVYDNGNSTVYKTLSHNVEVISFKRRLPLYNGETVMGCQGWIWRISKENESDERIELNCMVTDMPANIELGSDPGEHLESVAANNDFWTIHIGTEDGEVMHERALNDDWMPKRYSDELDFYKSFTNIQLDGFVTQVPGLTIGEKIYFHYLVAYDKYSMDTVKTWLAVDESKRKLENWIGIW